MMSYRKESKKRKLSKKRILVLCEGKTEKLYLEGLRKTLPRQIQRDINLDIIKAKQGEPVTAIKELKQKIKKARHEKQAYYENWIVFDDDKRDIKGIFQQLPTNSQYVYNSISIEFWFLLHSIYTSRQFKDSKAVIVEFEKKFGTYSKTDADLWNKFEHLYDKAKENAVKLRKKHSEAGTQLPDRKPYSNMDMLVDRIKRLDE